MRFKGMYLMRKNKPLSTEDYLHALDKMKRSPKDWVGILGEMGVTGLGGIAGASIAGVTASAAGVATLFGSSTLASILGGVVVTTTPVGWVIGSIGIGGAVGYGISKLIRSGEKSDTKKEINIQELTKKIGKMKHQNEYINKYDDKVAQIIDGVKLLIVNNMLSQEESNQLLAGIENGTISIDLAFENIQAILVSQK